jgi:hypothetical protein
LFLFRLQLVYSCHPWPWDWMVIYILVTLNPFLIFLVKDVSKVFLAQLTNVFLSSSQWLFLTISISLYVLQVVLKGLKQLTFNKCRACDVWNGKMIISKPNYSACFITSMVRCDPCPPRINRRQLNWNMPPKTSLLKNDKNSLNKKEVIHAFLCIAMQVFLLQCWI